MGSRPSNSATVLGLLIAIGITALVLFEYSDYDLEKLDTQSGDTQTVNVERDSADTAQPEVRSAYTDSSPENFLAIQIVQSVEPTEENLAWAEAKYLLPDKQFGYEKIDFVEFDFFLLLKQIKANHRYLAAASGRSPAAIDESKLPDFSLDLFGRTYPMKITRVKTKQIDGMNFVNARGEFAGIGNRDFTDIPAPYSWSLFINETKNLVTGDINTSTHRIAIQYTPDMSGTMVAWVSNEQFATFPPID